MSWGVGRTAEMVVMVGGWVALYIAYDTTDLQIEEQLQVEIWTISMARKLVIYCISEQVYRFCLVVSSLV